jgi:CBS domain-containing protein
VAIVDLMGVQLVSVEPEASVEEAIGLMLEAGIGSVAVCDGPRLVGILTERDVLKLAAGGARMDELQARQVMSTNLVTVQAADDVLDVARLMSEHRVRHVPVVHGENLLGIVAMRDVLDALAERLYLTHDEGVRETVHELLRRKAPAVT